MEFVNIPNIPGAPVRLAVVDGRIPTDIESRFLKAGICIIRTEKHMDVYDAISYHPDIMLHHIGGRKIVYAPGTGTPLLQNLESHGFELVQGAKRLKPVYPDDIAYNGARVGKFFFHNLKFTDPVLLKELTAAGVELVNVRQGYSKCSVAIIDENSIITSDTGIAHAAVKNGIDALLVPPQKGIRLPGLDYGFIGGSSGLVDKKQWAVFGEVRELDSFEAIQEFLFKSNCQAISLSDGEITDYGSLLALKT